MLRVQDIHFCISKRPIVQQVSFELLPNELTVILGPNGAGKTTLFKILSGELNCKEGSVLYNGKHVQKYASRQLAQIRSVMPQHSSLSFPFKAIEVVELGLIACQESLHPTLIQEIMEETQTWHLREELYGNLSGGEKQRIQLARVLVQIWEKKPHPRFLLLDEPTSSMDIALQHHTLSMIHKIKSRNIGVLMILHDLNLAANYADNIILIKNGSIYHHGAVDEVMKPEYLERVFDHPIEVFRKSEHGPLVVQSIPKQEQNLNIKRA